MTILLFAVTFAVGSAAAELVLLGAKQHLLNRFIGVSWMVVWMTPLANLVLMLAIAGVAMGVGAALRRPAQALHVGLVGMAWLAVLSPLTLLSQLHVLAAALLAFGAAIQIVWFVMRRWDTSLSVVRAVAPYLILAPALAAGAVHGSWWLAERRMLAQLPPPAAGAPNVLLLILDTVRARSLSLFDAGRPTSPELERIAAEGTRFSRAVTTAPWTLPSHGSVMTGRYPRDLDGNWLNPIEGSYPTLAGVLGRNGYRTAGFVANLLYTGRESGIARDFSHYDDYQISAQGILRASALVRRLMEQRWTRDLLGFHDLLDRRRGGSVSDAFLRWLAAPDGSRPFFAFLNFYDAHAPYLPPRAASEQLGVSLREKPLLVHQADETEFPPDAVQAELDAYEASILALDTELGRLLGRLDALGYLDNTLLVVASDHGEEFNEHGRIGHGNTLYLPALRVPLVLRFPGRVPAGVSVDQPVTLADLPATILDLAGIGHHAIPGISFAQAPAGGTTGRPAVSEEDEMRSIVAGDWHILLDVDGRPIQIFDLGADPLEQRSLIPDPGLEPWIDCLLELIKNEPAKAEAAICDGQIPSHHD